MVRQTKKNINDIDDTYRVELHEELKLLANIYCENNKLTKISAKLIFVNLEKHDNKTIYFNFEIEELKLFFKNSLDEYLKWIVISTNNFKLDSLKKLTFPFPNIREGQSKLIDFTYDVFKHNEIGYAEAPTGIGKTMATLFASLKSINSNNEKIFFLTAKTTGKLAAKKAIEILIENDAKIRAIIITAKMNTCLKKVKRCVFEKCSFAKGFYEKVNLAISDLLNNHYIFTEAIINEYAIKYKVCNFELSLHLSYYCDIIIGDYNYAFDPFSRLIRYFENSKYEIKLLIDEAHNLVDRSLEMYSSTISTNNLIKLFAALKNKKPSFLNTIQNFKIYLTNFDELSFENIYYSNEIPLDITIYLKKIISSIDLILEKYEFKNTESFFDDYYEIKHFLFIADLFSNSHKFILTKNNNEYELSLVCFDASKFIYKTIKEKTKGTLLFSATLSPISYYRDLITPNNGAFLELESNFNPNNLNVISQYLSTKYDERENSILDIVKIVNYLIQAKTGNHIVFFSSYEYLNLFNNNFFNENVDVIVQESDSSNLEKDQMFNRFKNENNLLGLFVLGGSFAEGLDFYGEYLSGVVIVGVGHPQINFLNNLKKDYFDYNNKPGYEYAYTYPGITKVIQAAGRLIRTENDRGSLILIDKKYYSDFYLNLLPKFWRVRKINNNHTVRLVLKDFYKKEKI